MGAVEVRVADGGLRFCAYQYQNLPLRLLRRRWRDAERLGFERVVELRHGGGARPG